MAYYCIRPGLTYNGDGSTWAAASGNGQPGAFNAIPTTLQRGTGTNIYFLATGSYGSYTFNDGAVNDYVITIRKAVPTGTVTPEGATLTEAQAHGVGTGWDDSYGEGQATFSSTGNPVGVETNYWTIDGVIGSGTSGHGIKISNTGSTTDNIRTLLLTGSRTSVEFKHVEMEGPGTGTGLHQDIFYSNGGGTDCLVSYCYVHDVNRMHFVLTNHTGFILEHSVIARGHDPGSIHAQAVQYTNCTNTTFRYNIFEDISSTGIIVSILTTNTGLYVYGNVFWNKSGSTYDSGRAIGDTAAGTIGARVYNNTFVNLNQTGASGSLLFDSASSSDNIAYNNIWYNCNFSLAYVSHDWNASDDAITEDHPQTITSAIFTDYAGGDFHLEYATDEGDDTLGSPYNIDPDGITRGADGVWDRGAYEFDAGVTPPSGMITANVR